MKYDYHIIVIGAGSAGLVVASGATALGAKVALIEGDKMGGDCLNTGCIPSKSFLKGAHLASELHDSHKFGITSTIENVNFEQLMTRVHDVIASIAPHDSVERYRALGVDVIKGYGSFLDHHTILVNGRKLTAKNIVISTGSEAFIPPIKGLSNVNYYTSNNIFDLKTLPKHLIVLGAGPIGSELGQGFKYLGSEVTLVDKADSLFTKDDPEVGPIMKKIFEADNINLQLSSSIIEVREKNGMVHVTIEKDGHKETLVGDCLLVSLGRKSSTEHLNLEVVGIQVTKRGYIETNNKLQSNIKNIYACGDVTGPFQFTHMAGYQAGIVIRNTIFHLGAKVNYDTVPWTTYTKPEVAHVGLTEHMAKDANRYYKHHIIPLESIDRAKADDDVDGFLKVIIDKKNRLIGATLVGNKAGEQIPIASLAIKNKMKLSAFLGVIFSYPTEAEIFKFAALEAMKEGFKPWQQNLIKKIFLR